MRGLLAHEWVWACFLNKATTLHHPVPSCCSRSTCLHASDSKPSIFISPWWVHHPSCGSLFSRSSWRELAYLNMDWRKLICLCVFQLLFSMQLYYRCIVLKHLWACHVPLLPCSIPKCIAYALCTLIFFANFYSNHGGQQSIVVCCCLTTQKCILPDHAVALVLF